MSGNNKFFNIHSLPREVITVIGSYLSPRDIRILLQTSKGLNKLIVDDPEILKKLPLQLSVENEGNKLQDVKKQLSRSYKAVEVYSEKFTKSTALWLTSYYCSKLCVLTFSFMTFNFSDGKMLRKTFQSLHEMQELSFISCEINGSLLLNTEKLGEVEAKSLKKISIINSHFKFLSLLRTPQLVSLEAGNDDKDSLELMLKFLTKQPLKIQHLRLFNIDFKQSAGDLKKEYYDNIKIPLRTLAISRLEKHTKENFMLLIGAFVDTLEEIQIGKFKENLTDNFYALVISKCKRLVKLSLYLEDLPKAKEFYENLEPNVSIASLIVLDDELSNKKALSEVLKHVPNLEHLTIRNANVDQTILRIIATNCKKLKTLESDEIDCFDIASRHPVCLLTLIKLSVCHFRLKSNNEGWHRLVKAFPNLETLSFHHIERPVTLNNNGFKIFTKELQKIKHLAFGIGFKANKYKFNVMLANCKNLQTVEVLTDAFANNELYEEIKDTFKKPGLRFIRYNEQNPCTLFDSKVTDFWNFGHEDIEEEGDEEFDIVMNALMLLAFQFHQINNDQENEEEENEEVLAYYEDLD